MFRWRRELAGQKVWARTAFRLPVSAHRRFTNQGVHTSHNGISSNSNNHHAFIQGYKSRKVRSIWHFTFGGSIGEIFRSIASSTCYLRSFSTTKHFNYAWHLIWRGRFNTFMPIYSVIHFQWAGGRSWFCFPRLCTWTVNTVCCHQRWLWSWGNTQ